MHKLRELLKRLFEKLPRIPVKRVLAKPVTLPLAVIILIIVLFWVGAYLYGKRLGKFESPQNAYSSTAEALKIENAKLLEQVGKLIKLPEGEEPLIATVNDASKLKSGSEGDFFARAENGDKVIIYSKAGKGIIYRPKENKIIEIASMGTTPIPTPKE